jgi:hypothetical protein
VLDRAWFLLGCCNLLIAGCSAKHPAPQPVEAAASASAGSVLPLDHLAPDELAPGKVEVYGFAVPRGMEVESRIADRAYISGHVSPEALANYVREQVVVSHVEIGAARTVFPMARIKAGPANRVYNLEVLPDGPRTRLVIKDVTPPPPPQPGLTDAERWRAAGLTPDGRPLDPQKVE